MVQLKEPTGNLVELPLVCPTIMLFIWFRFIQLS